jgi:pyruvate formate lyase activating enzyme
MQELIELRSISSEVLREERRGMIGYIHSYTTGSALDGPGLRYVLWTTGCAFRCQYCHNPDTWHKRNGEQRSVESILTDIAGYERFLRNSGGGVTISGGEPLIQAPFVSQIFQGCKRMGLHTALDTNGYFGHRLSDSDLAAVDLVLLDIKSWDPDTHRKVTGCEVGPVLVFAQRLADLCKPTWIRFVLVPGLTDDPANVHGLARFVSHLSNVERVEILPFHQMGAYKWKERGIPYPLEGVKPPSQAQVKEVIEIFRSYGCNAQ